MACAGRVAARAAIREILVLVVPRPASTAAAPTACGNGNALRLFWGRLGSRRRAFLGQLAALPSLGRFTLAGGTGLALVANHRNSVDFDFFYLSPHLHLPPLSSVKAFLGKKPGFRVRLEDPGTLHADADGTHLSFLATSYPWMRPPIRDGRLAIAHPVDIGLMKLSAIISRGSRKDFIDLACILDRFVSLRTLLRLAERKYAGTGDFIAVLQKPLLYFAEAAMEPDPDQLDRRYRWGRVTMLIETEARKILPKLLGGRR